MDGNLGRGMEGVERGASGRVDVCKMDTYLTSLFEVVVLKFVVVVVIEFLLLKGSATTGSYDAVLL